MTPHSWIFLILIASLPPAQVSAPAQESAVLSRPVALMNFRGTSAAAVAALLSEARVAGGIISLYDGCAYPSGQLFKLEETTFRQGLDYVSRIDKSRGWAYRNAMILVGLELADKTILKTIIRSVKINSNDTLNLSTQRLLESAEVKKRIKKVGLVQMQPNPGISSIRRGGAAPPKESPTPPSKQLHNITLEAALNVLASTKGRAVWHYEQFICDNKSSFRLDWAVTSR